MAYTRLANIFEDPSGVKPSYHWTINHSEEEEVQNSRQMGNGASTNDIGLMPQQGAPLPKVFQWKGTIFTQADKDEMDSWYHLDQSIYLTDFSASKYEVLITDWTVKRDPVAANKRGGVPWLWRYTITFRILKVISGDWSQA